MAKKVKIQETGNSETMNIRGIATFPEIDEQGRVSVCVAVSDETATKVLAKAKLVNPEMVIKFSDVEHNENDYQGVHAKSKFEVPVYNADGELLDDERFQVYWGADIIARINLKEYEYKSEQGITAYLAGVKVITQGEQRGVSFEDFEEIE